MEVVGDEEEAVMSKEMAPMKRQQLIQPQMKTKGY